MTSVITHIGIGIIFAEIALRLSEKSEECIKNNRWLYWIFGALGGLTPDLDFVPALITGESFNTYHHTYTHTLLALGIVFGIIALTKFHPLALAYFLGFSLHLLTDFIDNTITPFGPFLPDVYWGLRLSEMFEVNGWGVWIIPPDVFGLIPYFWSYYDILFSVLTFMLLGVLVIATFSKKTLTEGEACRVTLPDL